MLGAINSNWWEFYGADNGTTWTLRSETPNRPYSLLHDGSQWLAGGSNAIFTSPDGVTWTTRPLGISMTVSALAQGTGLTVAGGTLGRIATSPDGITWTERNGAHAQHIQAIAFANGLWVAAGSPNAEQGLTLQTSPDGITWTARTVPNPTGYTAGNALVYAGGQWLLGADDGKIYTSPDGLTWTEAATLAQGIYGLAYGAGVYVAVGNNGFVATSPNGTTWTTRTGAHGSSQYRAVAFGEGVFVASGWDNKLSTSPDGITWTLRLSDTRGGGIVAVAATTEPLPPPPDPEPPPRALQGTITQDTLPVARVVRAYRRDTGERLGETVSDAETGAFSIDVGGFDGECYVIALAGDGMPLNDLIYDRLTPG